MPEPTSPQVKRQDMDEKSTPTVTPDEMPVTQEPAEHAFITFTVVYDNNPHTPGLRTAWGFACWVEYGEMTVLFDTGGQGDILLENMAALKLDPLSLDAIVLSHNHDDHTGGLVTLLDMGITPVVYVPASFPKLFKNRVMDYTQLEEVTESVSIGPHIRTTGEVDSRIPEQALVVETAEGLVVLTGCAHPGIVSMVTQAQEISETRPNADIALVMGGFHLSLANQQTVSQIITEFQELGVKRVAPCHCTGDGARQLFAQTYGSRCTLAGVGSVFAIKALE